MATPKPLFVVGSPRSGTTLIGATLATARLTADLGEYIGYDFSYRIAQGELGTMPGPATNDYLVELRQHAHDFPRKFARGKDWFLTSAPWNLLVANQIAVTEPEAIFVLCYRRVEGVSQSLKRSFDAGYYWAGSNTWQRINLWCKFYNAASNLPINRTVVLEYDELLDAPEASIEKMLDNLERLGFPGRSCDLSPLARSHATEFARSTVASIGKDGNIVWHAQPSRDVVGWTGQDRRILENHESYIAVSNSLCLFLEKARAYRRLLLRED